MAAMAGADEITLPLMMEARQLTMGFLRVSPGFHRFC